MATIWENIDKPGTTTGGWSFNETGYSFNQVSDPNTGAPVLFNGAGPDTIFVNLPKN